MKVFEWNELFMTGIAPIDEQHKRLIGLVNGLADSMRSGKSKEMITNVLEGLRDYTKTHFGFEEAAFEKYGYPKTSEHKKSHETFVGKVDELITQYENGLIGLSVKVLNFLTEWSRTIF
jgi:hemerythrin-like metal-binding protein